MSSATSWRLPDCLVPRHRSIPPERAEPARADCAPDGPAIRVARVPLPSRLGVAWGVRFASKPPDILDALPPNFVHLFLGQETSIASPAECLIMSFYHAVTT